MTRSRKRPLVLLLVGVLLILGALKLTWWRYPTHVYDEAEVLTRDERYLANTNYAMLTQTQGVDVRVLLTRSLGDLPLEAFALDRMRKLGVGEATERRGVLVVLDLASKRVRFEVGPNMEFLITDAYSSYLAHDVIGPMLAANASPMRMTSSLWHVLRYRIDEGLLGREWDPTAVSDIRERQRLALGGGAGATAALEDLARLANQPTPPEAAARYGPQSSAAEALARYLDWVQEPFAYVDAGLLSTTSRELMTDINSDVAVGTWRFDQIPMSHERFVLVERSGRAVGIPTMSPLTYPVWLSRGKAGWQVELLPDFTIVRGVFETPWRWTVMQQDDPWLRAFGDLLVPMADDRVNRFRDGNNTPIPERGSLR